MWPATTKPVSEVKIWKLSLGIIWEGHKKSFPKMWKFCKSDNIWQSYDSLKCRNCRLCQTQHFEKMDIKVQHRNSLATGIFYEPNYTKFLTHITYSYTIVLANFHGNTPTGSYCKHGSNMGIQVMWTTTPAYLCKHCNECLWTPFQVSDSFVGSGAIEERIYTAETQLSSV
jgi:hypothetical protein